MSDDTRRELSEALDALRNNAFMDGWNEATAQKPQVPGTWSPFTVKGFARIESLFDRLQQPPTGCYSREEVLAALDQALGGTCCPGKEQDCPWDRYRLDTIEKMKEALDDYE